MKNFTYNIKTNEINLNLLMNIDCKKEGFIMKNINGLYIG
jgi:hypothetical protein